MDAFSPRNRIRPEARLQKEIIDALTIRGWYCKISHGSEFHVGFPDVFLAHSSYGPRWLEVKVPGNTVRFEESQIEVFTQFALHGVGVWILQASTEYEISKLFKPANWSFFTDTMKVVSRTRTSKAKSWERTTRVQSSGPERERQEAIKNALRATDWYVLETAGNLYQFGFPDLYACHKRYGARWIEVKNKTGYIFTPGQMKVFPEFEAKGVPVHVMQDVTDMSLLFGPSNWRHYL